jgi:hypothetical protein
VPVPLPLVAIERASGSVSETWLSGAAVYLLLHLFEIVHLPFEAFDLLFKAACQRFIPAPANHLRKPT